MNVHFAVIGGLFCGRFCLLIVIIGRFLETKVSVHTMGHLEINLSDLSYIRDDINWYVHDGTTHDLECFHKTYLGPASRQVIITYDNGAHITQDTQACEQVMGLRTYWKCSHKMTFLPDRRFNQKSYYCTDRGNTRFKLQRVVIHVASGPTKLRFAILNLRFLTYIYIHDSADTVSIAENSNISCITDHVYPTASVTWSSNLTASYTAKREVATYNSSTVFFSAVLSVDRSMDGTKLNCTAVNNFTQQAVVRYLTAIVFVGPTMTTLNQTGGRWGPGKSIVVIVGESVEITCTTDYCKEGVNMTSSKYNPISGQRFLLAQSAVKERSSGIFTAVVTLNITNDYHDVKIICTASNKRTEYLSANSSVTIQVISGPTRLAFAIFSPSLTYINDKADKVSIAENSNISCITDHVYPAASVTWFSSNLTTSYPSTSYTINGSTSYSSVLSVDRSIDGMNLSCTAVNNLTQQTVTRQLTATVFLGPTMTTVNQTGGRWGPGKSIVVKVGESVEIICTTDYCKEGVNMTFSKYNPIFGQRFLLAQSAVKERSSGIFTAKVTLNITDDYHDVKIICTASNKRTEYLSANSSVTIQVISGPTRLTFAIFSPSLTYINDRTDKMSIAENSNISCITDHVYPAASLTWLSSNLTTAYRSTSYTINGSTSYSSVLSVDRSIDGTNLSCTAVNNLTQQTVTRQLTAAVFYGPRLLKCKLDGIYNCSTGYDTICVVQKGINFTIHCVTDEVKPSANITCKLTTGAYAWREELPPVPSVGNTYSGTTEFYPLSDYNNGKFTCWAENSEDGNIQASTSFIMQVSGGPSEVTLNQMGGRKAPKQALVTTLGTSVEITCRTDYCSDRVDMTLSMSNPLTGQKTLLPHSSIVERNKGEYETTVKLNITKESNGVIITCTASNEILKNLSAKSSITIYVAAGPTKLKFAILGPQLTYLDDGDDTALIDENHNISCITDHVYPDALVTWSSSNSNTSYTTRRDVTTYNSSKTFSSVVSVDWSVHGSTLICTAVNGFSGQTVERRVTISLYVGPTMLSFKILSPLPTYVDDSADTVSIAENSSISCITDHVYPAASVVWSSELITSYAAKREVLTYNGSTNYSSVLSVDRSMVRTKLNCTAVNSLTQQTVTRHLTAIVLYGPTLLKFEFGGIRNCSIQLHPSCVVPAGTVFVIQCITDDVQPAVNIDYKFQRQRVSWTVYPPIEPHLGYTYKATYELNITLQYDNTKVYCIAQNSLRPNILHTVSVNLQVSVGPTLITINQTGGRWGPDNSIITTHGTSVEIACTTDYCKEGVDMAVSLYNPKSGQTSPLSHIAIVESYRGIFSTAVTLNIAKENHGIIITCTATNKRTEYLSAKSSAKIEVLVGPKKITAFYCMGGRRGPEGTCLAHLGSRITLYCVSDKSFQNVDFNFDIQFRSGQTKVVNATNERLPGLMYSGKNDMDISKYYDQSTIRCRASNSQNKSMHALRSMRVALIPGPPKGPHTVDLLLRGRYYEVSEDEDVVVTNGTRLNVTCTSGVANIGSDIDIRLVTVDGAVSHLQTRDLRAFDNMNEATSSAFITYEYHSGTIECVASNSRAPDIKASKSRTLDVTAGPYDMSIQSDDPVSRVVNGKVIVNNGTKATIRCQGKINPGGRANFSSNFAISTAPAVIARRDGGTYIEKVLSFTRYMNHANEVFTCSAANSREPSLTASVSATLKVVVHGVWSDWLEWGGCSTTCGKGIRRRERTCTNPSPSENGGDDCPDSHRHFAACKDEFPCDPYHEMHEYLWTHVVDITESKTLTTLVLVICCVTFVFICVWHMRNAYLAETKRQIIEGEVEFDNVVAKLLQMLEEKKKPRGKIARHITQHALIPNALHVIDSGTMLGRFLSTCPDVADKKSEKVRQQVEPPKKLGDINCLKHELNKITLTLSQGTKDREKIQAALTNYNKTAAHMKREQLDEDVELIRQSQQLIMALTLKSTIQGMEKTKDHAGMKRMLTVVARQGLFDVLDDFKAATDRLNHIRTMNRYTKMLMTISRQRVAELQRYRFPTRSIHDTLVAALLILGVNEGKTKDWVSCLQQCYEGHDFQSRLRNFNVENLHLTIAARALEILGHYNHKDVKTSSNSVYYFYAWAHATATYKLSKVSGPVSPANLEQQLIIFGCRKSSSISRKQWSSSVNSHKLGTARVLPYSHMSVDRPTPVDKK